MTGNERQAIARHADHRGTLPKPLAFRNPQKNILKTFMKKTPPVSSYP